MQDLLVDERGENDWREDFVETDQDPNSPGRVTSNSKSDTGIGWLVSHPSSMRPYQMRSDIMIPAKMMLRASGKCEALGGVK